MEIEFLFEEQLYFIFVCFKLTFIFGNINVYRYNHRCDIAENVYIVQHKDLNISHITLLMFWTLQELRKKYAGVGRTKE